MLLTSLPLTIFQISTPPFTVWTATYFPLGEMGNMPTFRPRSCLPGLNVIVVRMSAPVLAFHICMSIGLGVRDVAKLPAFGVNVWTAETIVSLDNHADCSIALLFPFP